MRTLTDQLTQYAAYHRDPRNVATHFVGIPMIVLAVAVLLGRPSWSIAGSAVELTPAWLLFGAATLYYLLLDVPLGIGMACVSVSSVAFGQWSARLATPAWLALGLGLFLLGWVIQFIGHVRYEHRKPAFLDDVTGLVIGPLFLLAELVFGLGARNELRDAIEARLANHVFTPGSHTHA